MLTLSNLLWSYKPVNDPYGTHLNILRAIGKGITTVLELGAGQYSTPLFLDRSVYPDLTNLCTIEQNKDWVPSIDDPRHHIAIIPEPIENFLDTLTLDSYDLIFIDNSDKAESREATLRYIAEKAGRSLIVTHDWERESYREAGKGFRYSLVDDRQVPWSAILWGNL